MTIQDYFIFIRTSVNCIFLYSSKRITIQLEIIQFFIGFTFKFIYSPNIIKRTIKSDGIMTRNIISFFKYFNSFFIFLIIFIVGLFRVQQIWFWLMTILLQLLRYASLSIFISRVSIVFSSPVFFPCFFFSCEKLLS